MKLIYAPFYAGYVARVNKDVIEMLNEQLTSVSELFASIPADKWEYQYAPEKWTLYKSWQHVIDTERIMTYRALRIIRGDKNENLGYNQDEYAIHTPDIGDINLLIDEWKMVRNATILLFQKTDKEALKQIAPVSGNDMNAAALAHICAGHCAHHIELTNSRYL